VILKTPHLTASLVALGIAAVILCAGVIKVARINGHQPVLQLFQQYDAPGDLLFATERETILLAIVVKFCQRISGAGFRTDKYLRSVAKTESSFHED
jgi:hypothetical protein